jgi:hypothetical protein
MERLRSPEVFIATGGMVSYVAEEAATEIEKLRAALDAAVRALHKAGEQFAFYANEHAAKDTADEDKKAATNQQWAQRCFAAHDAAHDAAMGGKQ